MEQKPAPSVLRSPMVEEGNPKAQFQIASGDEAAPLHGSLSKGGSSSKIEGADEIQLGESPKNLEKGIDGPEGKRIVTTPETSSFPQLSNASPPSLSPAQHRVRTDGDDEEPAVAHGFERSSSPSSTMQRNKGAVYHKVGEEGVCKMHKFSLYETSSRFYMVGGDIVDRKFRILKIDRTAEAGDLSVAEDDIVYTKKEMNQLLNAVDDGNRSTGGLKLKCSTWGLLGFVRFTGAYYMLVITKRSQVAMIGGHYIYQVDGTDLVSLAPSSSSSRFKLDRDPEEARFIGILSNLDLSRSFYFSYSYGITRTLQNNILHERELLREGLSGVSQQNQNSMFIWNHHLLEPASKTLKNVHDWCLPIVHGFVDQASNDPF